MPTPRLTDRSEFTHSQNLVRRGSASLLTWLPDEPLFCLISRNHQFLGHQNAADTTALMFGGRFGTHHDLPNGLARLESMTDGALGTAREIAVERTILKYYRPFVTPGALANIIDAMLGDSVAHLKYQMGLITSRFRANHPLKACPSCMAKDRVEYGWAYWHLQHQFPGVWWCREHAAPLHESLYKSTGAERFLWHLPKANGLRLWISRRLLENRAGELLASLSETITGLVLAGSDYPLNPKRFAAVYRTELDRRGWLSTAGRLRFSEIVPAFLSYSRKVSTIPEFRALPKTYDEAVAQLGRLFRGPRTGTHPLRHAIIIDWLFSSATQFLASAPLSDTGADKNVPDPTPTGAKHDTRAGALLRLLSDGHSMRSAAEAVGVDTKTAMAWAAKAGISPTRRPKVLTGSHRVTLIRMIRAGCDKDEIAKKCGVSVGTVTDALRTEPGLQERWHALRFEHARRSARRRWSSVVKKHHGLGRKALRLREPAAYAWLYRNDREWLLGRSPPRRPFHQVKTRVDWKARDVALSSMVEQTAAELMHAAPKKRIRLWKLCQLIPELKAKRDVLHRLPLTRSAIEKTHTHYGS